MYRIGVDVGGTFTDFTLLDETSGEIHFYKTPSTPHDPSEAIENGLRGMLDTLGYAPVDVSYLGHGTTVATNIVIERRGARTGLVTTRGFRDVLELGRQARPSIYDYRVEKPPVLIPRDRRVEVIERVGPAGEILTELDEASLETAVRKLADLGVESVAICFLHSYRRPEHEARARAVVEAILPEAYITLSSEILPEFREFERMSTVAVNAFVGPKMGAYLEKFRNRVRNVGIPVEPYTIHSNGGLMSADTVYANPVRTCVSGPAAGVVGATEIGRTAGLLNLITFDVGGTSTDVSLIADATPLFTSARLVAGYPVKTPMLDIHVIGAGGGSIAAIDDAGSMKVGPRSAGAAPGPVAYGRGGTEPTITDANLCLGRLDAGTLLGGRMQIDLEAARTVIRDAIATPLGLTLEQAAHGIIQIANANMSRAIRSVSVEKGYDMGEFALCAFGGAGPLHAAEVAVECGLPRILIPREPGTLCARGMLLTDLSSDYVRSYFADSTAGNWKHVLTLFETMAQDGQAWLDKEDVPPENRRFKRVLDARYRGQNFEVKVDCDGIGPDGLAELEERFHAAHTKEYGYDIRHRAIQFVSARLQAIGDVPKAPQAQVAGGTSLEGARAGSRPVYFDATHGWLDTPIYRRGELPAETKFSGPAIINEMSATSLILPGQTVRADGWGNLIVSTNQ
ncbi:hydantoinase/oxoprolinase family protein [Devosia psychrophila]|uniref:5-oxoprolinase n=1 Tax=Devosia psychrophila TaxID=728005 RepID=A0A0F5PYM9_9HYPH|nr:hydantoinase/oxoprolinase family protein [Devosia psychrophila]KKC33511.1 5-oxoprolinase [Devosia psychrophila]SFD15688.1 N-methylhydantoinase A [Devosia psychrophila]